MKNGGLHAIELFAGVGGFRLGLERAGHQVIWSNEWDKYACDVYDFNFQGERIIRGDIRAVDAASVPAHDLIVGGFPCQAFSVAGKRRGFEDTRGTLFYEIARIAAHHRTPYLLLENVKGLLSHDEGRTFGTILEALDDLGYDVQWQVLNSKDFGVPQNRERVILVCNLRDRPRPEVFPLGQFERGSDESDSQICDVAQTITATYSKGSKGSHIIQLNPGAVQDRRIYATAGISPTINPAAAAGGAVIPKISQAFRVTDTAGVAPTLSSTDGGGAAGKPMIALNNRVRRLTPIECERLQAFPDNWTQTGLKPDGTEYLISDTQRYKMCGNAVTANVIEAVARKL